MLGTWVLGCYWNNRNSDELGLDIVLCQRLELTQAIMRLTLGNHALDFCNAILKKSVVQESPK